MTDINEMTIFQHDNNFTMSQVNTYMNKCVPSRTLYPEGMSSFSWEDFG